MNLRLSSFDEKVSYLYERQSIPVLIELLTKSYLIDVRQLDTRLLSSSKSEHMHRFFRYVAQCMTNAYENRWKSIKQWLGLSVSPKQRWASQRFFHTSQVQVILLIYQAKSSQVFLTC